MISKRMITSMLVFGLAVVGIQATALAGASHRHIDELALQLQRQSRALTAEFRAHYRHAPEFRHLMSDSVALARKAAHIHAVAHAGRDLYHLQTDLRDIDRSFHHLEEVLARIEHHVASCHSPRCGHFHGDTRHVRGLMASIGDTIHHLRSDVGRKVRQRQHYRVRYGNFPVRYSRHTYNPYGNGRVHDWYGPRASYGGVALRTNGFRFGFGF